MYVCRQVPKICFSLPITLISFRQIKYKAFSLLKYNHLLEMASQQS